MIRQAYASLRIACALAVLPLAPLFSSVATIQATAQTTTAAPLPATRLVSDLSPRLNPSLSPAVSARAASSFGKLQLSFEPNRGQTDKTVQFLAREAGYAVFLTPGEAVISLNAQPPKDTHGPCATSAVVRLELLGANTRTQPRGLNPLPGKSNYFPNSDPSSWRKNVPTYSRVSYNNLYPGIDLVYYGNQQGRLEHDFIVAAEADPGVIRLRLFDPGKSKSKVDLQQDGSLHLATDAGTLALMPPTVYQISDGKRLPINAHYLVSNSNQVEFKLGAYDRHKALVIDPVLVYGTLIGGSSVAQAQAIAVDAEGNAYITGFTDSMDFPTTAGSYSPTVQGPPLVKHQTFVSFVAKLNPTGTALVYSTFLGEAAYPQSARGIAIDAQGYAYITGFTGRSKFPTVHAFQRKFGGGSTDSFVTKLSPAGDALIFSTYLGGSGDDYAMSIAVDSQHNVYVAGATTSPNFPLQGALQPTFAGSRASFITKLDPSGRALAYSTFLGGSSQDSASALAVNKAGEAYIAGLTSSNQFPLQNAIQSTPSSGYVAKLNAGGDALVFSTYYGSTSSFTNLRGIALDPLGHAVVVGSVYGPGFPLKYPIQSQPGPNASGVVFKIKANGSAVYYSSYLDQAPSGQQVRDDGADAVAVDKFGDAYIAEAASVLTLSASGQYIPYYHTSLSVPNPTALTWITGMAVDSKLNVYVVGNTYQGTGLMVTPGAFQTTQPSASTQIGYVGKLIIAADLSMAVNAITLPAHSGGTLTYTLKSSNSGPEYATFVHISSALPSGTTYLSHKSGGGSCSTPAVGSAGAIECVLPLLNSGETYTVTLTVQVNSAPGSTLSNTATTHSRMQDLVQANNTATLTTPVQ